MRPLARMHRSLGGLSIALASCVSAAEPASAQQKPHAKSSLSVVEVKCPILVDGSTREMRATGFAWLDPQYVVTALHSVVGCEGSPQVYSEQLGDASPAEVVSSFLEADLALLRLERSIGLEVVEHATSPPDVEREFYLYGYPLYARTMAGGPIDFKWGLGGEAITSLDRAFRSDDLTALFRSQAYPAKQTQILRIQSPIVSGYSGSPIFDEAGRVVAIVDGALLNGTVGANWSIPAHLYLPKLLDSEDEPPEEASSWAKDLLKSSISDVEISNVPSELSPIADEPEYLAAAESGTPNLNLVRQISFGRLQEGLEDYDLERYEFLREFLELYIDDAETLDNFQFYIYEESETGATFGLPAELFPYWNDHDQQYEVVTESGKVILFAAIQRWDSFDQAITEGRQFFIDSFALAAEWDDGKSPVDFELSTCIEDEETGACDLEWQWRYGLELYYGKEYYSGDPIELTLTMEVSDDVLLALALTNFGDFNDDMTEEDQITYLKLQAGLDLLTDFSRF